MSSHADAVPLSCLLLHAGDKDKLDDLRSKACLRRAEALAAMGNNQAALEVSSGAMWQPACLWLCTAAA